MDRGLLYLSVYDPHTPLTGTGVRGRHVVEGLARRFPLDLVYMEGSGQPPIPEVSARYAGVLPSVRERDRVAFRRLSYFLFSPRLYRLARERLRRRRYAAVVCDYGISAIYGLLLSREFGVPFVYFSHNVEHQGYLKKVGSDPRRIPLVPWVWAIERRGVRKARLVVAISETDAAFFDRWADRDRMMVVPQGFDPAVFHPFYAPPRNRRKVVLFCGNYAIQFNREVVEVVMDRILDPVLAAFPDALFRFVGAHPPSDVRHPNVEFTGFVEDYPERLKGADVVITPMLQGVGSPTKVFEALACGKPVVATPAGARGVSPDHASLRVREIDGFPAAIVEELRRGKPVTAADFDRLRSEYSWPGLVERLAARLEGALWGGRGGRAPEAGAAALP